MTAPRILVLAALVMAAHCQVLPTAPGATAPADPAARGVQPGLLASALARPAGGVPQPAAEAAARPQAAPPAEQCCHVVAAYWPYKECKQTCSTEVCTRGWGTWSSLDVCCSPNVAFPEGCTQRPAACFVVENHNLKTCIRDDRKCLQGYGVFSSEAACCAASFGQECPPLEPTQPCWVVDTYFPARLCRESRTLCRPEAGVQTFASKDQCCMPGSAFSEGCSPAPPVVPCWVKDEQHPKRSCTLSDDTAVCHRGWGVYTTREVCCSPNVAYQDGCTPEPEPGSTVASAAGP